MTKMIEIRIKLRSTQTGILKLELILLNALIIFTATFN